MYLFHYKALYIYCLLCIILRLYKNVSILSTSWRSNFRFLLRHYHQMPMHFSSFHYICLGKVSSVRQAVVQQFWTHSRCSKNEKDFSYFLFAAKRERESNIEGVSGEGFVRRGGFSLQSQHSIEYRCSIFTPSNI